MQGLGVGLSGGVRLEAVCVRSPAEMQMGCKEEGVGALLRPVPLGMLCLLGEDRSIQAV